MADLEQRVATLERDMSALKVRVGTHEEDTRNIPDLIKLEFRLASSQTARLSHEVADLQGHVTDLQRRMAAVESKMDALPRVLADLIVETLDKRGNKR